ncbi:hypothetical protein LCGC14_1491920 [marine sediment metagenome]|uniref:site-specific DNA-methyltransferase (cytosine-N(4)-specific) n=1 Tax=marine sediment metagenome TaxID=412755 RepID=A0A0F9M882_9ZZZZ
MTTKPQVEQTKISEHLLNTVSCMDAVELLGSLPDNSIDMALTSPPYDNLRTYGGHSVFDFETIAQETYRVLKPGGVLVWVVGDATINGSETLTSMRQALYFVDAVGFRMHDTMIYDKHSVVFPDINRYHQCWEYMFVLSKGAPLTFTPQTRINSWPEDKKTGKQRNQNGTLVVPLGYGKKNKTNGWLFNLWRVSTGYNKTTKDKEAYAHPAMFPEKLAERHILTWSNPGDVVLDYFMGSGTTAKMARNNGRHYIGCDVNEDYVKLARARLAKPYTLPLFEETVIEEKPEQAVMELG